MKKIIVAVSFLAILQTTISAQRPGGPRPDHMPMQRPDTSTLNGAKKTFRL